MIFRKYYLIAGIIGACTGITATVRADEVTTITISLPPSPAVKSHETTISYRKSTPAPRSTALPRKSNRAFASRGGNPVPKEKVVGRLGVLDGESPIFGSTSAHRRIARAAAGTYLALNSERGDFYGVLMVDRSTGWIKKSDVRVLSYEVVAPVNNEIATRPGYPNSDSAVLTSGQRAVLDTAYTYLGVPYVWGGTKPTGLDCSGFVQRCFRAVGAELPRTAHEQISCGIPIPADQLEAGDRLYFAGKNGYVSHTGIYVGNDYFIHASSANHAVAVSRLSEPMYTKMFVGARR
ncbi:MAG: C40 family peptidase [Chthonomonadales bacterium]